MRVLFFVFALVSALAAPATAQLPAPPPPAAPAPSPAIERDWRQVVSQTRVGAFVVGNPAAPIKLAEYLSYTCPHCAAFERAARPVLFNEWVRRGVVRVEYRNAVRDPVDLAAAMLARCAGTTGFFGASEAIFRDQAAIMQRAAGLAGQNVGGNFKAMAERTGLITLMRRRGMSQARIDQCFATDTDRDRLLAMANAAFQRISGTPSFEINDRAIDGHDWASVETALRAAGAR